MTAAEQLAAQINARLVDGECRHFCLTGGRTVGTVFAALLQTPSTAWENVHFWFSDERCVPVDDPRCNAAAVERDFLRPLTIPDSLIHRMTDAESYNTLLHEYFTETPVFDIALLSMGDDGHVASLFPGRTEGYDPNAWAVQVPAPTHIEPHVDRVSLTYAVLNRSCKIFLLVSGDAKRELYERRIELDLPVSHLNPDITEPIFL